MPSSIPSPTPRRPSAQGEWQQWPPILRHRSRPHLCRLGHTLCLRMASLRRTTSSLACLVNNYELLRSRVHESELELKPGFSAKYGCDGDHPPEADPLCHDSA